MGYESEISKLQTDLKSALQIIKDLVVHVNAFEKKINRDKKAALLSSVVPIARRRRDFRDM